MRAAESDGPGLAVETRVEAARGVTEIVVYARDRRGLFASIAGAMALSGASIVDARIATLADGVALDTFWIQDIEGRAYAAPERLERLTRRIKDALAGKLDTAQALASHRRRALPSRTQVFTVPPRVIVDNKASGDHTVVEVNGRDRIGFLHDVTSAITALGLQISSAHISTYGERVVDVFYVKDAFGLKVEHPEKIKAIRERLLAQVAASGAEPAKETAAAAPRKPSSRKSGGVLKRLLGRSPRAAAGAGK